MFTLWKVSDILPPKNLTPIKLPYKRSNITDCLFWTVSLWRFKAFCKSQCRNMLYMLLQCSCVRILPVWLHLSSCLIRIPSLHGISFLKWVIRPLPFFSFSVNLSHYPNLAIRSSLTKPTLNEKGSLCGHFLEDQDLWPVLKNISSLCSCPG